MLGILREKKNNPLIVGFMVAIILVFVAFFGPGSRNCGGSAYDFAATVNGERIGEREFAIQYSYTYRMYQQQIPNFNRESAQTFDLRRKVLDRMVNERLLAEEARHRGLEVDDEALKRAIIENENFKRNGRFDPDIYQRFLAYNQMRASDFEESLRTQLLSEKVATLVSASITVSGPEARRTFEAEERTMDLEFIRVPSKSFEDLIAEPSDADAQAFLAKAESEDLISKYYEKNRRQKYDVPKKVRARHILVRVDKDAPPDVKDAAKAKIKQAMDAVKSGMSFEDAAKKWSEDSSAEKGGDLGFFSKGQMVPPFEEAAFALAAGQTSGIVESPFGLHFIRVDEITEPVQRKLEDVKTEIAKALVKDEKAAALAATRAAEILAEVKAGATLTDAAAKYALSAESTGSFSAANDFVPRLGIDKELSKAVWQLTMEKPLPDAPYKAENAYIVYRLKEKAEPTEAEFKTKGFEVQARLANEKAADVLTEWTNSLRERAKVVENAAVLSYDDADRQKQQPNF